MSKPWKVVCECCGQEDEYQDFTAMQMIVASGGYCYVNVSKSESVLACSTCHAEMMPLREKHYEALRQDVKEWVDAKRAEKPKIAAVESIH